MSDGGVSQNRAASWKHGLKSEFALTGNPDALQPGQRARLSELREELSNPEGVRQAMVERAARLVLVAEWGEAWLRDKAESEGPVAAFTSPIMRTFFTAAAEARRALEALQKLAGPAGDAVDPAKVLETLRKQ